MCVERGGWVGGGNKQLCEQEREILTDPKFTSFKLYFWSQPFPEGNSLLL